VTRSAPCMPTFWSNNHRETRMLYGGAQWNDNSIYNLTRWRRYAVSDFQRLLRTWTLTSLVDADISCWNMQERWVRNIKPL